MNHGLLVQSAPAHTIAGGSIHPSQRRQRRSLFSRALIALAAIAKATRQRLLTTQQR